MAEAIIRVTYDPDYLESQNTTLEDEIQGWVSDSNIEITSVEEI